MRDYSSRQGYRGSSTKKIKLKRQGPNRQKRRKQLAKKVAKNSVVGIKYIAMLLLVAGTLVMALAGSYKYYKTNDVLVLKDVLCEGSSQFSNEEIIDMLDLEMGLKMWDFKKSDLEKRLLENPWIKSVKLRRQIPSKLKVVINEHEPIALVYNMSNNQEKDWNGLSETGELLPNVNIRNFDLPILEVKDSLDVAELKGISQLLMICKQEFPHIFNTISQVKTINSRELAFYSRENNYRFLVSMEIEAKKTLVMWQSLLTQYKDDFSNDHTIDLRVESFAYVS